MEEYGSAFEIVEKEEDDLVDVFETEWYKSVKEKTPPGRGGLRFTGYHIFCCSLAG